MKIIKKINIIPEKLNKNIFDILFILYMITHLVMGWDVSLTSFRRLVTILFLGYSMVYFVFTFCKKDYYITHLDNVIMNQIIFVFFAFISCFWAYNRSSAFSATLSLISALLITFFVNVRVREKEDIDKIISALIFISIIDGIYILKNSEITNGIVRLGYSEKFGNIVNLLASTCAFSFVLCIYKIKQNKLFKARIVYLISCLFLLYIVVRCGSKMGILLVLIGTFLFLFSYSRLQMRVTYIILGIAVVVAFIYLVNTNYTLNVLFYSSFKSLLNFLTHRQGYIDISTNERANMIIDGLKLWMDRPLLGWGASNFASKASYEGVYAHNTYIEILSGLGLIGFILYYYLPITKAYKLFIFNKQKNAQMSIAFSLIFSLFLYNMTSVTYTSVFNWVIIFIVHKIVSFNAISKRNC